MINEICKDTTDRMVKSIETLKLTFSKLRANRAHAGLLDHIMVSYYGTDTPLNQVANVSVQDSRTLSISPWEKQMVPAIEKAIMISDLGLNPVTSGVVIRVPLPPLTEERRRDMVRIVKQEAEAARVAIRNIRRDSNHTIKELVKEKEISEDDQRHAEETIQKITDKYINEVEQILVIKERDLMEV
ncbi:ribosome recycling factor [Candidatus Nitrosacidococcus sp. I8]|uniref:ribosome recycling factor n=1 Tax=Candidatus Nitrosacidococcus sp. I8 TaxID=2942908 RepID=UPI002227A45F|nr:ribosome recycling factor [Candidatus Nitrosacidococcus sp. I8]CAH9017454.1 Ribosome-recycling factor [Candidatus Nitrosacidococcus sp. I8]